LQNWDVDIDKKLNINFKNSVFMADAGYDSSILRKSLNNIFLKVIIPFNKRNTKDTKKIKSYIRLNTIYEKHINNYIGFIYLSLIDIILKF